MIRNWFKNIGPGPLVAAAFIGPGTVTVCTLAGVNFGFALLWAMLLSILATVVLQEMSARLGIVSQKGLSEVIRTEISNPILRTLAILLILAAIVVGNAAYEAGNISGSVLGLETLIGNPTLQIGALKLNALSLSIGVIAFVILYLGNYKILERALISLVIVMSVAFLVTAILTKPDLGLVLEGLFVPKVSSESILTIIALVGTTVVPYNLFLHASLVKEKWTQTSDLKFARKDTIIAVVLGGVVSMCIIISAAAIKDAQVDNAADLAKGLEPFFGNYASYFLSVGLFAAGITSAITAPLAAAYVATGCLGWDSQMTSKGFKAVWMFILVLGVLFSSIGFKSIEIIQFAQVANGLLLPIIAGFLLWIMNKSAVLGKYKNTAIQNVFGILILAIALFLGAKSILKVFELI
ncbi:divalent metal cation transporter [Subsaximicrobium wynnwilliamsii]|uniref:Divalent metal cation transporter n=1 Tax=Subsaximicrobium wynnwilliamsii TaxID=291179 RepID=A0A5C6ZLE9_9FLAO|nr:Nramp family divalent metal transporter [Subsaximicrobium wynnwilliamsii]TXD84189.1 divalent metal cation transporter [Subsaximicrobium wynnwilliamsii]TXD89810.1 divalent metal cation transporter [Subsaximicrobium wynnwilliamsii]TXE03901.1 divalent metal cation transporter [Subsaximicrobium wynnwilliamsii]